MHPYNLLSHTMYRPCLPVCAVCPPPDPDHRGISLPFFSPLLSLTTRLSLFSLLLHALHALHAHQQQETNCVCPTGFVGKVYSPRTSDLEYRLFNNTHSFKRQQLRSVLVHPRIYKTFIHTTHPDDDSSYLQQDENHSPRPTTTHQGNDTQPPELHPYSPHNPQTSSPRSREGYLCRIL